MLSMPCAARKSRCSCFIFRGVSERIAHIAVYNASGMRWTARAVASFTASAAFVLQASFSQKTFREFFCFTRLCSELRFFFFAGFFAPCLFLPLGGFHAHDVCPKATQKKPTMATVTADGIPCISRRFLPRSSDYLQRYLTATQLIYPSKLHGLRRLPVFCRRCESLSAECLAPSNHVPP